MKVVMIFAQNTLKLNKLNIHHSLHFNFQTRCPKVIDWRNFITKLSLKNKEEYKYMSSFLCCKTIINFFSFSFLISPFLLSLSLPLRKWLKKDANGLGLLLNNKRQQSLKSRIKSWVCMEIRLGIRAWNFVTIKYGQKDGAHTFWLFYCHHNVVILGSQTP